MPGDFDRWIYTADFLHQPDKRFELLLRELPSSDQADADGIAVVTPAMRADPVERTTRFNLAVEQRLEPRAETARVHHRHAALYCHRPNRG